jgi:ABC-type multidrug transport system fused ATPase/permease subunit
MELVAGATIRIGGTTAAVAPAMAPASAVTAQQGAPPPPHAPSPGDLSATPHATAPGDVAAPPHVAVSSVDFEDAPAARAIHGVSIDLRGVGVQAGGHVILRDVSIAIEPGEHVAIVGPSGAGKSTLVGVLLGWHQAARGSVLVDGDPLDEARLEALRAATAWADPAVRLWNRSLVDNLRYGGDGEGFGAAIDGALLKEVLETLPDGMQTPLGEGGGLVSGGEGQRVRLARAMMRGRARLVILDEPFRGVDRADRNLLLRRCRRLWRGSTLLYITHDMRQTLSFDRVAVIDRGRLVEEGSPQALLRARPASRFSLLLESDERARNSLWTGARWRRVWLEAGRLREDLGGGEEPA